ncbi:hypothetical protein FGG08_002332 [Glutinoglossum americanum]|uniref:Mis6 domain-containing protein n=1 Tax=Glutinoglossum americanum TaxID=1670608 RepID=A0A9P8ID50_9PEZI|nr:hypothetical protein FGG08_002332 [Glutinoglossum americanum]
MAPTNQALEDALTDLKNASVTPAKQRKTRVAEPVAIICEIAFDHGLSGDSLDIIVDIITQPNELDQNTVASIVNSLYPSTKVSEDVVLKIVGCLGQGQSKPPSSTQAGLLRWLIMVHGVLESHRMLSNLYGVLFNMLDMISLRLELARNIGNEPALVGLIRMYKDYYPDVIIGSAGSGRASFFSHPSPEWCKRLLVIQEESAQARSESRQHQSAFKVVRNGAKRSKVSAVPEVHTSRANESSVTLEEVENVNDFIEKLDRLELPNQLVSVLGDPLLQKFLSLRSSDTRRIESWLSAFFDDELQLAKRGQHPSSRLSNFLRTYIASWDGAWNQEVILELVACLPIRPWDEYYDAFFRPVEEAILDNSDSSRIALLGFYTSLFRHWTVQLLAVSTQQHTSESPSVTMQRLTAHVDLLSLTTIVASSSSIPSVSAVLAFYECVADAIMQVSNPKLLRISVPGDAIVYLLSFNGDAMSLSRLCAILAKYKRAFEASMATAAPGEGYPRDYVNHFNGFLMDICNCLWRNRAFNKEDTNALGCLLPDSVLPALRKAATARGYSLPTLFSLSYSEALCALSIACFRELEDRAAEGNTAIRVRHAGPVTQRSLTLLGNDGGLKISWGDYRLEVLKWLEEKGLVGVGELMYNTLKQLMLAKGSGAGAAAATA